MTCLKSDNLLRSIMHNAVIENELAGCSALVLKDNKELFFHAEGLADKQSGTPVTRDTVFRIFSMTKPICAIAAMILVERGELDLLDNVSKFFPSFKAPVIFTNKGAVNSKSEINIKQLLQMTSGLVYGDFAGEPGRATQKLFNEIEERRGTSTPCSTLELAHKAGMLPLAFEPGSNWEYGISADVLGAVIEKVSGKKFGQFLKENIFDKLEMSGTAFYTPPPMKNRLASAYTDTNNEKCALYKTNYLGISISMENEPSFESGGAGLVSTIDDYARFASMLLNDGIYENNRIVSKKSIAAVTGAKLNARQQQRFDEYPFNSGFTYGYFMRNLLNPENAVQLACKGEYGWEGWLGTYFANFPREGISFLFMTQKTFSSNLPVVRRLRNIIVSELTQ